jgi:RimJ/RimL family protein N-acetyltransferase
VTPPRINRLGQPIGPPLPDWSPCSLPPRQPIEGRYVRVEPIDERFAADLHTANLQDRDGRNWTYLPYGPFASEHDYRQWMNKTCFGADPLFHAIVDRGSGRAAGLAAYMRIKPESGSIEVGHVCFSPLLQRARGATEAMYLMMQRAFSLGYRRYEWKCDALNGPSRSAAQRLGFSFEGIFRQASVYKERSRDTAWYAVVDSEWPALVRAFDTWLDPGNFDSSKHQQSRLSDLTRPLLANRG